MPPDVAELALRVELEDAGYRVIALEPSEPLERAVARLLKQV